MGQLKPGARYIYEHTGNEVYAREFGADPADRVLVGYDYDPITGHKMPDASAQSADGKTLHDRILEDKMWGEIRRAAQTNPTLQDALERAIVIYKLSKLDE